MIHFFSELTKCCEHKVAIMFNSTPCFWTLPTELTRLKQLADNWINVGAHSELFILNWIFLALEGRGGWKKKSRLIENKPRLYWNLCCFLWFGSISSVHTSLNHLWAKFDSTPVTWGKRHREEPALAATSLGDLPTRFPVSNALIIAMTTHVLAKRLHVQK